MRNTWILAVFFSIITGSLAVSGPLHEAAMGLVREGRSIADSGNLDAAMATYDRVMAEFPEEHEAILWARVRKADCLMAGGRYRDALQVTSRIWESIQEGKIADPEALFWGGNQHTKCLGLLAGDEALLQAATETLAVYERFDMPDLEKRKAAGWLYYWLTRELERTKYWDQALETAEAAWNLGEETEYKTLAAWGRLLMARMNKERGNLLLAQALFQDCREKHYPGMDTSYKGHLELWQTELDMEMGLFQKTRQRVLSILADDAIEPGIRLHIAVEYARRIRTEENYRDAVGPLAIAMTAFSDIPVWGPEVYTEWVIVRRRIGSQEFPAYLSALDDPDVSTERERQAIRIQLAEELLERGLGSEVMVLCDSFEGLCSDPLFGSSVQLLRAKAVKSTTPEESLNTVEMLLLVHRGDELKTPRLLSLVRDELWFRGPIWPDGTIREAAIRVREEYPQEEMRDNNRGNLLEKRKRMELTEGERTYGDWLEEKQDLLSPNQYRLEMTRWLRDRYGDHEGALKFAEEMLAGGDSLYRNEAHLERIVNLYCLGRAEDAKRAIEEYASETPDTGTFDHILYQAGKELIGENRAGAYSLLMRVGDPSRFGEDCEPAAEVQYYTAIYLDELMAKDEAEALILRLRQRDPEYIQRTEYLLNSIASFRRGRARRSGGR